MQLPKIGITMPQDEEIRQWLELSNRLGPRLTGSPAHTAYVDWLVRNFESAGLLVVRHPYVFTRWQAEQWSLQTIDADGAQQSVPVSSYYPFCNQTPPSGVVGQLLNLGDIRTAVLDESARGQVIYVTCAVDGDWQPPITKLWGTHDPQQTGIPAPAPLPTRHWKLLADLRLAGARVGAVALVIGWANISEDNAAGQYQPLEHLIQHMGRQGLGAGVNGHDAAPTPASLDGLAALWLGPKGQSSLFASGEQPWVRMTLRATHHPNTTTDTVVAKLPGTSEKTIVVLTHTDGVNACQENGGIAQVALARHFSSLPLERRKCGLVFVATTGHFAGGFTDARTGNASAGEMEDVLQWHPELARDAVAVLGVEQLGVESWLDDGEHYVPSGKIDFAHCISAHAGFARILLESFAGTRHCAMYAASSGMLGHAGLFAAHGVPAALYMGIPSYAMATAPDGHLGKLSPARMHEEVLSLAKAVTALDSTLTNELR